MSRSRARKLSGVLASTLVVGAGVALAAPSTAAPTTAAPATAKPARTVDVQILSFNDFHGNLQPPAGSSGRTTVLNPDGSLGTVDSGGVSYLTTHLREARAGKRYTTTVAAGDIVGASPFISAVFHDEPTVESMNALGLDFTAVGNHEFDEGYKELQRLQRGGCIPDEDEVSKEDSCPDGEFQGAAFTFLAANVKYAAKPHTPRSGKTILPAYGIKNMGNGVRIGFIGMTLKETPTIVTAAGVKGLDFTDEVKTANALVPVLKKKGVNAIVVLIHQGGVPNQAWYDAACGNGGELTPESPILPIAQKLSPAIDMVISGHTHQPYVCNVPDPAGQPRLVTSASSFGRLFTETTLKYDLAKKDIVRASVAGTNMIVTRDVPLASDQEALIARYAALAAPVGNEVVGSITADIGRTASAAGETPLGNLIADAQLADPSTVTGGQTPVAAFMNPGGIRTDLVYAPDGVVTYAEAFAVQPFSNYLVSKTMTGAQLYDLLEQQWTGINAAAPRILQVSDSVRYAWQGGDGGTPRSVVPGSLTINGTAVPDDDSASYRVVMNSFLSDGGDGFAAFTQGTGTYFGGLDLEALTAYLGAHSPVAPPALGRITKQ